jgi:primosomal protein N'
LAIKLKALRDVLSSDSEFTIRRIYRWYSKTFATPLQEAFDIPLEDILLHYYEERFSALDQEELQEELILATENEQQRAERKELQDSEMANEYELLEMSRQANEAAEQAKRKKDVSKSKEFNLKAKMTAEGITKLSDALSTAADSIKEAMQADPLDLPMSINFEEDKQFESLLDKDALG